MRLGNLNVPVEDREGAQLWRRATAVGITPAVESMRWDGVGGHDEFSDDARGNLVTLYQLLYTSENRRDCNQVLLMTTARPVSCGTVKQPSRWRREKSYSPSTGRLHHSGFSGCSRRCYLTTRHSRSTAIGSRSRNGPGCSQ